MERIVYGYAQYHRGYAYHDYGYRVVVQGYRPHGEEPAPAYRHKYEEDVPRVAEYIYQQSEYEYACNHHSQNTVALYAVCVRHRNHGASRNVYVESRVRSLGPVAALLQHAHKGGVVLRLVCSEGRLNYYYGFFAVGREYVAVVGVEVYAHAALAKASEQRSEQTERVAAYVGGKHVGRREKQHLLVFEELSVNISRLRQQAVDTRVVGFGEEIRHVFVHHVGYAEHLFHSHLFYDAADVAERVGALKL